ncbi:MAG: GTPase [Gammaproteobacteria bacterium]|nr:GTPase [Gammaproteobacteria bacterium]
MKLIFVYNANSGKLNTLFDIAHKLLSPETYQCDLCSLTHGALSEKQAWKEFRERTGLNMVFLHKDEFEQLHKKSFNYPVILKQADSIDLLLNADEISQVKSVDGLIALIEQHADNFT